MINRVILTGRLTKDVEMRKTNDGIPYTYFTIAVNRKVADQTDFVPCVAWRATAELMGKYLNKGALIGVEGKLEVYTKNDNGNYETRVTVNTSTITFLESKAQSQERAGDTGGNMTFSGGSNFNEQPASEAMAPQTSSFGKTEEINASDINIDDIQF